MANLDEMQQVFDEALDRYRSTAIDHLTLIREIAGDARPAQFSDVDRECDALSERFAKARQRTDETLTEIHNAR